MVSEARKEYSKKWQKEHREQLRLANKKYREKHREEFRKRGREYYHKHRDRIHANITRKYWERKEKLFEILGGKKCVRCGFDDERALQFDHKFGGGLKEQITSKRGRDNLKYYIENPNIARKKLQVLCANCNWIKKSENKEHPSNIY